jgi:hypothetical protein
MNNRVPARFLLLLILCGCSREPRPVNSPGIGSGATASGTIEVESSPSVILPADATDDRALIGFAVGGTQLSDGSVIIADKYDRSIRTFDRSGHFVRSTGRRGGGPGEFQTITWLGRCGRDSIFVWDDAQYRMSVFDNGGRFARSGHLEGAPIIIACSPSRQFATLLSPGRPSGASASSQRLTSRLLLDDARGDSIWSLSNVYIGQSRPLSTVTRIALGDQRLYVGTGDSAYVDEYDLQGHKITAFKVGDSLRTPTTHQYESAIDRLLSQLPGAPSARQAAKKMMLAIPMPAYLPPYTGLFVDSGGSLWVVISVAGDDKTEIRIYDSAGNIVGTVSLPLEMRILEIGDEHILGAYEDEGGQEHVAVYRYRRR